MESASIIRNEIKDTYILIIYIYNEQICETISFNNETDHTVVNDNVNDQNKVDIDYVDPESPTLAYISLINLQ